MKSDIFNFVRHFPIHGSIGNGCNSSFITLVPKVFDPLGLGDYRPICLLGSIYKILAKILAMHLKSVISSTVNEVQSAYIEGSHILDGPLMLNEIHSWEKKNKVKAFLLKVDFEKAFDFVNWRYLDAILEQTGFGVTWRS